MNKVGFQEFLADLLCIVILLMIFHMLKTVLIEKNMYMTMFKCLVIQSVALYPMEDFRMRYYNGIACLIMMRIY